LYRRETLYFEKVQTTLSSKELNEKFEDKEFAVGDGLVVRGK